MGRSGGLACNDSLCFNVSQIAIFVVLIVFRFGKIKGDSTGLFH